MGIMSEQKINETLYKTIEDHKYMGLDNQICFHPAYFCRSHRVYLSNEDVERKHCMTKPTFDLMGTKVCSSLEKITAEGRSTTPTYG